VTSTGKEARKRYGNRFAAKRRRDAASRRSRNPKSFSSLAYSTIKGNGQAFALYGGRS